MRPFPDQLCARNSIHSRTGLCVESRRGSGGYIRILRLSWGSPPGLLQQICCSIGSDISQEDAEALLSRLAEIGALPSEAMLRASLRMETSMLDPPWDGSCGFTPEGDADGSVRGELKG